MVQTLNEHTTGWNYATIEVSEDKHISRPGVGPGNAHEIVGMDMQIDGGLNPLPGCKKVYELDYFGGSHTSTPNTYHTTKDVISDLFPVNFRIGVAGYGYGFVYRANRTDDGAGGADTTGLSDIFIDVWNSNVDTTSFGITGEIVMEGVDPNAQMDVTIFGRLIYIHVEGRSPAFFWIEELSEVEYTPESDTFNLVTTPTTNYDTNTFWWVAQNTSAFGQRNGFLHFDMTEESSLTVKTAFLKVNTIGNLSDNADLLVKVGRSTQTWITDQLTWNEYATGQTWPGGSGGEADISNAVDWTIANGALGLLTSPDIKSPVQAGLTNDAGEVRLTLTEQASGGGGGAAFSSLEGTNPSSVAKLVVTFEEGAIYRIRKLGTTSSDPVPGPGRQPRLASPERSTDLGSLLAIDDSPDRPGQGQVVLTLTEPEDSQLFPDQSTGLCAGDPNPESGGGSASSSSAAASSSAAGSAGSSCDTSAKDAAVENLILLGISPNDEQTNVSVETKLRWTARMSDNSALPSGLVYRLIIKELDENEVGRTIHDKNVTSTEFDPGTLYGSGKLLFGTQYTWEVRARFSDCPEWPTSEDDEVTTGVLEFETVARFEARKIEPGDYAFGYFLYDSKTGRRSAFSEIGQVKGEEFAVGQSSDGSVEVEDHFIAMEILYDSSRYDQAYIYRSVKVQDAGGTFIAGVQNLDAIIDLTTYHTCNVGTGKTFDPASTDIRQAVYYYRLEDKQLIYNDVFTDRAIFDEKMPFGGAALFYENTMLVSNITSPPASSSDETRVFDAVAGLGELRWSSLVDISPELFPPQNRYVPNTPSNEIISFGRIGGNAMGFSRDRMYHIRKHNVFIKVHEMHEGFGILNHRAVDHVGSLLYFVTSKGLKAVDTTGRLDDVRTLNSLIIEEWVGDAENISVAYDAFLSVLFVHNKTKEEMALLWFNTARVSELHDAPWEHIVQGKWPMSFDDTSDYTNTLTDRALFLQNTPTPGIALTGWKPRVYILDHEGRRTISGSGTPARNGKKRIAMMDITADSRFEIDQLEDDEITVRTSGDTLGSCLEGAYVYVIKTDGTLLWNKKKIVRSSGSVIVLEDTAWDGLLSPGDRIAISPMVCRWVGHNVGISNQHGQQFGSHNDFFRVRHVSSLGCSFTDVSGPPADETTNVDARYRALVYRGTGLTPQYNAVVRDTAGNDYSSVEELEAALYAAFGESTDTRIAGRYGVHGVSLSPGVEILCPDLDFRLLGVLVNGSISETQRTQTARDY